jgi:hypothetical protein
MPAIIKLTEAKCRALRKRYDQGTPLEEMAKDFGYSRIVLVRGIKRAGGEIRSRGRKCSAPIKGTCQCKGKHRGSTASRATAESREQKWRRQGSRCPKGFPLQPHETILFEDRIARFCPVPIRYRLWRWFRRKVSS